MRKRLTLLICMLLMSFFGFVGCKSDPYKDMSLSFDGATTESIQQLLIERTVQSSGGYDYAYPMVEFEVSVNNFGDADPSILVSGWEGYLKEPTIEYLGNGVSRFSSQVVSHESTGGFILKVMTKEGDVDAQLKYEIDLKLESFELNEEKLQAVTNNYEICLSEIDGLISYTPEKSTQKDITYSVVCPSVPYGDGYSIDGKWADEDATYFMSEELLTYLNAGYRYASVVKDSITGKQTLKVYPYFVDAAGNYAYDTEGNPIPSIFPSILDETSAEGDSYIKTITLKAQSKFLNTPDFIDIEVVTSAGNTILQMNSQLYDDTFVSINKDKNNEYNVVLVDKDIKGGIVSGGAMTYYTERELLFYVESLSGDDNILEEYRVVADNIDADDTNTNTQKPVSIIMIGDSNQFKVESLGVGNYKHKFTVEHNKYPGLFNEEIYVNFKVISMPFKIDVNGYNIEIGGDYTVLTSVYNVYPRDSFGSKFKVNTSSDFDYFLYLELEDPNYSSLLENLVVRREGDGEKAVFASMSGVDSGYSSIGSTVEGKPYTLFDSSSTFYLSHKFEELPTEYLYIYIGISFAVSDSSYTDEVKSNFLDLILIYPLALSIENGINEIAVTDSTYHINLSSSLLEYEEDEDGFVTNFDTGITLWEMPAGKTFNNSIKSITYDEDLIKVYPFYNEVSQVTTLYMKYVPGAVEGETEVEIETLNGLKKSVKVYTYVPTVYQYNGELTDTNPKMPLSISVDTNSSAFLYYTSGKQNSIADAQWELYSSAEASSACYYYDSVNRLFMITNATQKLSFYDYQIKIVDGREIVTPIDITDKVRVSFSYPNYVSYSNGELKTNSLITYNKNAPIIMTVKYDGGYEYYNTEGKLVYGKYTMKHNVELYIYNQLQGVEVLTAKSVNLYIDDSLGYYSKDKSSHTIVSTYIPNEVSLGADWNKSELFEELRFQPVELWYDYQSVLNSNIIGDDGKEIKVKSLVTGEYRNIKYSDLFDDVDNSNYQLTVKSVLSEDLITWFGNNGYTNSKAIENILQQHIFTNNIIFTVNVYITQFQRLQNVNQIKFTSKFASKISDLKLDVNDDGVYFEVKKDLDGNWTFGENQIVVNYTINNNNAVSSELVLENYETLSYSAKIVKDNNDTSGKIIITPKFVCGIDYLYITPKDNIIGVQDGKHTFYDNNMVLSFRIKVADGSKGYEFEISDAEDYLNMYNTTKAGYYYHYIITRDINLKGYDVSGLNVLNGENNLNNSLFYLSGKHSYLKNGIEITKYNTIYNLEVNKTINGVSTNKFNIGLFGQLDDCATLDNIYIKNSSIVINESSSNKSDINIGFIAGFVKGSVINSSSVHGNIRVVRNNNEAVINVGSIAGLISNGEIANLPGNYMTGIVSSSQNVYVDIEVTSDLETLEADKTNIGGVVAIASNSDIENLQVVNNITTTIRANIGGVIGVVDSGSTNDSLINTLDVSSNIIANLSTQSENVALNIGGLVGVARTKYLINNSVINYIDIGSDEEYTWENRVNILVYAQGEKVNVGGIVGLDINNSIESVIQNTYIRSYYNRVINDDYKGNIYVIASSGSSVGGLIGDIKSTIIRNCYFDGNISVYESIANAGMLFGSIENISTSTNINNCYAVGLMYNISLIDNDDEVIVVLTANNEKARLAIGTNKAWNIDSNNATFNSYTNLMKTEQIIPYFNNVYVIANEVSSIFVKNGELYYVDNLTAMLNGMSINNFFKNKLSYSITEGYDSELGLFNWFWNNEVNLVRVDNRNYAFPVLMHNSKVLYDLVPSEIDIIINQRYGIYDVTFNSVKQVIMYINRDANGNVDENCYYEMMLNYATSEFSIKLIGGTKVVTDYINVNNLKQNDKIEFVDSRDGTIINIVGNRIYPVSAGKTTLTVRSYVSKSIKSIIEINVIDGINNYDVLYNDTEKVEKVDYTIQGDKIETNNVVYVDETTEFMINPINVINGINYVANENIGYILEILDASDVGVENGIIKINGVEYKYDADNIENNIHVFNSKTFKVSGVYIGTVKFALTPYINLSEISYIDTYISLNEDESGNRIEKTFSNVYILNKNIDNSNLQNLYELNILARAKSITTSIKNVEIDSTNKVDFDLILETANVKIVDNQDDTYTITILEDVFIQINNKKYNNNINLKDKVFTCTFKDNKYTCIDFDNYSYEYEYTLINLIFDKLSITKTNVDVLSRNNTYKLTLKGYIRFDRDFYRTNANSFDLNTVEFNISFVPESNSAIVNEPQMVAEIVPNEIKTIFTNFYSKGVDLGDSGEYEEEYPEYNESTFIVPGRDGLLKITLDEEFNNSSYITLTLDKAYINFVKLQQLAGIIETDNLEGNIPSIIGYNNVTSLEMIETENTYGIKLSKLSLNYLENNYFNNTYFVKVLVEKDCDLSQLELEITSFKTDSDNVTTRQLSTRCNYEILELPQLSININGNDYAVMGKGVIKELDIYYKGLNNDIYFYSPEVQNGINYDYALSNYLYIADEDGNRVYNKLSLEYIESGKKYYLYQDVEAISGTTWKIDFVVQEIILGAIEESKCSLVVDTVDFEIENVDFCSAKDGVLNMLHGQTTAIETNFEIRDIVVGKFEEIEKHKLYLNEKLGPVTISELEFAGTYFKQLVDGNENVYSNGILNLQYRQIKGKDILYTNMSEGIYNGITITRKERQNGNDYYMYYEITGTSIGDDTFVRLDVEYYYDENGVLRLGNNSLYSYNWTIDIQIIVNDNSTYDHPTPIETQDDLMKACSVVGGNYILLNNISLVNWKPQEALFDTLDGNGYIVTVESFDLSDYWDKNTANVGIFSTVSENSLIKNLTVDVAHLLKTDIQMSNDIALMRASTQNSYKHKTEYIDLGYIKELNFGVIAGLNNGAITNAKVISTNSGATSDRIYLHVLTTLGYMGEDLVISNIGAVVGNNSATGAISNSFAGVSINGYDDGDYYIEAVRTVGIGELRNEDDELERIDIYPFVIAGGNKVSGLVCVNDGIISNSYAKGLGVYNPFPTVDNSATAGLVVVNNNLITSTFVEGNEIEGYRATENKFMIESTGYIGGLVFENNALIENSYSNAFVQTLSSFLGGFVYINNESGTIRNSYSTAVNRNSLATGQFTGVKQGAIQNFGTYEHCYYLVIDGKEYENINEDAQAIISSSNPFDKTSSWSGFSFNSGVNIDGIWSIKEGETPKIEATLTDTVSFRKLSNVEYNEEQEVTIYNYSYDTYYLGTKENPLLIDKAENFDKYIIDSSYDYGNDGRIFGYNNSDYSVRYVRIVNNLNFENITTAQEYDGTYLYKVVFAGILDGNGMTLSNLNINTESTGLDNFGLFAQIGHEKSTSKSVVKNLSMSVRTYKSTGNLNAGILAGTIINSSIINIKINGNNQAVRGFNTAGAIAGLIYSTNNLDISLIDISIQNVKVQATYSSLGGTINSRSEDLSNFYKSFTVEIEGTQSTTGHGFKSLYDQDKKATVISNRKLVSYAGIVAGVILANNSPVSISEDSDISSYRTKIEESTINNIEAYGDLRVETADNAGGLFGYVGENTLIRNSKFIVSEGQLIKGFNNVGGIVGENHGFIELCSIVYADEQQKELDNSILNNEIVTGTYNLFDMTEGEPYYVVSIGGIAGYSSDGVIIDSYSTINVVKSLSYIAGGIVGYSEGYNYFGYVYNTGAVYGLYVVGGVIGFQVNDYYKENKNIPGEFTNKVHMDNVFSITNWNDNNYPIATNALDKNVTVSIRDKITTELNNNYKFMYKDIESNYYIKLPELGNAPINYGLFIPEGETEENIIQNVVKPIQEEYRTNHSNYYYGSVVGKAMFRLGETTHGNSDGGVEEKSYVIYDNNLISSLYSESNNVFSSTLGIMDSNNGTVESSDREDNFVTSSFVVKNDKDLTTFNTLSYRIAYSDSLLNEYELVEQVANSNEFIDKFDFNQVFTAQEYKQQLLGNYYRGTDYSTEGNVLACKSTKNIFKNGFNADDRFSISLDRNNGQFIDNNALIWLVDDILPTYSNGLVATNYEIDSIDDLIKAFRNSTNGKSFVIRNTGDDYVLDLDDTDKFVEFYGSVKSLFVGEQITVDNVTTNPKIVINVLGDDTTIASIFNLWAGVSIQNVDFEINILKTNYENLEVSDKNYGLFVNTLDGAYLTNCNFDFTIYNNFVINATGIASQNSSVSYFGENVGAIFGEINNSSIEDCKFNFKLVKGVDIKNVLVSNFGLLAGAINDSSIKNNEFNYLPPDDNASSPSITIKASSTALDINIGGIAGRVANTKFINNKQIDNKNKLIKFIDISNNSIKNIGGLFGYSSQSNLSGLKGNIDDLNSTQVMSVEYSPETVLSLVELNVSNVIGKSNNTIIDNYVTYDESYNDNSIYTLNIYNNNKNIKVDNLSLGSIVGYDIGGTKIGKQGGVGNYIDIYSEVNSINCSVGGLVGKSDGSMQLLTNSFYDGTINVVNYQLGTRSIKVVDGKNYEVIDYSNTSVGGLIGLVNGSISATEILSGATINVTMSNITNASQYAKIAIGGVVGTSNANVELTEFASIGYLNLVNNKDVFSDTEGYVYISGIIGNNKSIFTGSNGYTYIDLPNYENAEVNVITNGIVSKLGTSIYYAQEFRGNDYSNEAKYVSYAMADLFIYVSEYSTIYNLNNSKLELTHIGIMEMFVPSVAVGIISRDDDKFIPNVISNSNTSLSGYNIIMEDLNSVTISTIEADGVLSGRSTYYGKVRITLSGTSGTYFTTINRGVLSNIYLNIINANNGVNTSKVALTALNEGTITNCYVYGMSGQNYVFANLNRGNIYASVSAIKYSSNGVNTDLFAFVLTNEEGAVISDCYSSSFGYSDNKNYIIDVYLVENNYGTIQYSSYYVPSEMQLDNKVRGTYKTEGTGAVTNVYTSQSGNGLTNRNTIWTTENNHAQIIGMKDIEGRIVIRVSITIDGYTYVLEDVESLQSLMEYAVNYKYGNYSLSYEYDFFVEDIDVPNYNVIRVTQESDLTTYINSLTGGFVPYGTIIMFTNNINNGNTNVINISAGNLNEINLGYGSVMIGINTNSAINDKIVLQFNGTMGHHFVGYNWGIIADLKIDSLDVTTNTESFSLSFAPILMNGGLISKVDLISTRVVSYVRSHVAGLVAYNDYSGIISDCIMDKLFMSSRAYVNLVCSDNQGIIQRTYCISYSFVGNIDYSGV